MMRDDDVRSWRDGYLERHPNARPFFRLVRALVILGLSVMVLGVVGMVGLRLYLHANPCIAHSGISAMSGAGGYTGRVLCNDGAMMITDQARWNAVQQQQGQ